MTESVSTVTGRIAPAELGFTLMHEHLLCSDWVKRMCFPGYFDKEAALALILPVVQRAFDCGVRTVVDVTPLNLGRDIEMLEEISQRTGMQIVACTGLYADEDKWLSRISEDGLLDLYLRDLTDGMQGTGRPAGVIKCATDKLGFTDLNVKMLKTAARAQKATGVPLITHCRPAGLWYGVRQQDIFAAEGADLEKVLIGHFRIGDSLAYAEAVLRRGSYLGIDQMNYQERNLAHNLPVIQYLCDRGYAKQLIFSHDAVVCYNYEHMAFSSPSNYVDYAPEMLSYLKETAIGKMLAFGIREKDLETIFIDNPKRLFTR